MDDVFTKYQPKNVIYADDIGSTFQIVEFEIAEIALAEDLKYFKSWRPRPSILWTEVYYAALTYIL